MTISAIVISVLVVMSGSLVPTLSGYKAILLQSPFLFQYVHISALQN